MIRKDAIKIDLEKDSLFDELGLKRLRESYMKPTEKSPQERFSFVARTFGSDVEHARRLYKYLSNHWLSASTPLLSYGLSKKGLPISCYLSYIDDSAEGLVNTWAEVARLSMTGGGVGIGVGIRSEDDKSVGVLPHLKTYEPASIAYRQGMTRRGTFAPYLDISHPNILQFIEMRKTTGDPALRCKELHHGINVPDKFMKIIEKCMVDGDVDDTWKLIDPHTKEVKEEVSARYLWETIIDLRMETGEPYLHFIDESNRKMPRWLKKLGLKIKQSNICTEIVLPTDKTRTAVCCLSSLNLEYWEEWKDNYQFYKDVAEMLDNSLTLFIKRAPKTLKRAILSAQRERSIGVGALGFHALLQQKDIPFESALAVSINNEIFRRYKKYLTKASRELAKERGEAPDAEGTKRRFSHTMAIAPNASSSIIMGNTSPSVEPYRSNGYRQDTLSGSYTNKNKYLDAILKDRLNEDEYEKAWSSIITHAGSCQHLECLTEWQKDVFKTATEINQMWVVDHAAFRQKYIDQAQSINLFFKARASIPYLHHVHFEAWKKGLKTLYYARSDKVYHGESVNKKSSRNQFSFDRVIDSDCLACE
jgi:ribonucleoside-diphosphate reductase alpha chain